MEFQNMSMSDMVKLSLPFTPGAREHVTTVEFLRRLDSGNDIAKFYTRITRERGNGRMYFSELQYSKIILDWLQFEADLNLTVEEAHDFIVFARARVDEAQNDVAPRSTRRKVIHNWNMITQIYEAALDKCLAAIKLEREQRLIAFLQGTHMRLGKNSPIFPLDSDALEIIARYCNCAPSTV